MSIRELTWSKTEKKIARAVFDNVLERELATIRNHVAQMVKSIKEDRAIWEIEEYLRLNMPNF